MFRVLGFLTSLFIAWPLLLSLASAITVSSTILVFARNTDEAYSGTSGLNAHGIPYQLVLVPQNGTQIPALLSTANNSTGNFGGIIVVSEVAYSYTTGWGSALTTAQWQQLYNYQTAFGIRMVRLDVYPDPTFGTTTAIPGAGCCDTNVEQLVSFTDTSDFPTANLKTGAAVTTQNMWHYPATITNSTIAKQIAQFAPSGDFTTSTTAAVINTFGTRQQMVWFTSWATDWSSTSNLHMHAHIHWMTRGLFLGQRRMYFSTQIDDMHLETDLYEPVNTTFRIRTSDLQAHATWQKSLNSRLPAGSSYTIEIGHNGNGNIEYATSNDPKEICNPDNGIDYDQGPDTGLEFQKPLGTGTNLWPTTPTKYSWSKACTQLDPLASWFEVAANRDHFTHISHTFTHEALDNATYSDTYKEITFNQAWLAQTGISAGKFSPNGLIPPAITGLHNGDAIKAWMDNGIKYAVGDSSRPALLNTENEYWPLITTVEANGYAGLIVIPRWPTPIYYNCKVASCTLDEWVNTSGGWGGFSDLLTFSSQTYTRHLLGLRHDSFMFHQANLAQGDTPSYTVGPVTGHLSLLQIFVETVIQEMMRLTTWPVISIQHDALGVAFKNRMTLDLCKPSLTYILSADAKSITGVTVGATRNTCTVPVPVQFPVTATTSSGTFTSEKLGSDPLTIWTTLKGFPVTYTLSKPIIL